MKQKRWMTSAIAAAKAPLPCLPWTRQARSMARQQPRIPAHDTTQAKVQLSVALQSAIRSA